MLINSIKLYHSQLIIRIIVVIPLSIAFLLLIGLINNTKTENFLTNFIIVFMVMYFFSGMTCIENRIFMKLKSQKELNIFVWSKKLSGEYDLFSYLFEIEKLSTSIITNLQEIEARLLHLTGGELKKLRQLRAYIKTLSQQKFEKVYYNAVGVVLISILAPVINLIRSNENISGDYRFLVNPELSWGIYVSIFFLIIYYKAISHKHDNQRNLALNIIEGIIDERERDKSD